MVRPKNNDGLVSQRGVVERLDQPSHDGIGKNYGRKVSLGRVVPLVIVDQPLMQPLLLRVRPSTSVAWCFVDPADQGISKKLKTAATLARAWNPPSGDSGCTGRWYAISKLLRGESYVPFIAEVLLALQADHRLRLSRRSCQAVSVVCRWSHAGASAEGGLAAADPLVLN